MYLMMQLALVVMAAGFFLMRAKKPLAGWIAVIGIIGSLLFGGMHLVRKNTPVKPVLQEWGDDMVADQLAGAILNDIPEEKTILILHWRGKGNSRRVSALEKRLTASGRPVVKMAPPAQVSTGEGDEKMRITMEEGGVPPYFIVEAARQHLEARAIVVLLTLTKNIDPAILEGVPILYFDENSEAFIDWASQIPEGRVGAVVRSKPATSWKARDALKAGPEGAFQMRMELITRKTLSGAM